MSRHSRNSPATSNNGVRATTTPTTSSSNGSRDAASAGGSSNRRPPYLIKPLRTVGDTGKPTQSVLHDLERVIYFIQDERHLVAFDLYSNVQRQWKKMEQKKRDYDAATTTSSAAAAAGQRNHKDNKRSWTKSSKRSTSNETPFDEEEYEKIKEFLTENKDTLDLLAKKAPLLLKARDNMDDSKGWELAQTLFGVTTYYHREDDGSLSIKLEGELKGIPLFEQIAVLREIDLHSHWAPFVTSSLTIAHLDKLDTIGWIMLGLPHFGIARDICFRAIGCDCVAEDGSFLLLGRGVEDRLPGVPGDKETEFLWGDPVLKTLEIPPVPTRMGSGRATLKMFEAKIRVLGPDHCHTYILANVDPNLAFLPQSLLEFIMKKVCGFLLNKLQSAAKKILKDPVRNIHAQRMRDEAAFYLHWVLPKFKSIAADRGWEVPTISAFELSETQRVEADKLRQKRLPTMHSFSDFDDPNNETRSEPDFYHSKSSPQLGSNDDDSDISSLSVTSSMWRNNPIASYLREVESKTQERKAKSAEQAKRRAAARLQPRPFPMDKKERLMELKMYKERKRSFGSSGGGRAILPPVGKDFPRTVSWPRLWVVSFLGVLLFILLHMDRFLPTFSNEGLGLWSTVLRDAVTLIYIGLCGVIYFFLCDFGLMYAFEEFEIGMKSGEAVKNFYRSKVRLTISIVTGLLVGGSIIKAVSKASLKATLSSGVTWYHSFVNNHLPGGGTGDVVEEIAVSAAEEVEIEQAITSNTTWYQSFFDKYFSGGETGDVMEEIAAAVVEEVEVAQETGVMSSRIPELLLTSYSTFMAFIYAVFDWQMRVLIQSNSIGRSLESLISGTYSLYIGLWSDLGNALYSLIDDYTAKDGLPSSWRDDAISTLRVLLLNTVFFLLVVLFLLNAWAKTYRHGGPAVQDSSTTADNTSVVPASSSTTSESDEPTNLTPRNNNNNNGGSSLPIPKPKQTGLRSWSTDSSATRRLRLKFRRKRKDSRPLDDDDDDL